MFEVEEYTTDDGKCPFKEWLHSLKDKRAQAKLFIRMDRAHLGNLGDWKPLEDVSGIFEMREHSGPGYRIFFNFVTKKKLLILTGSAKKNQNRAIVKAKSYLADYERRAKS
ncbi:MAG: type II toxin-antitoxin system RelE/ParE family toxin [Candidatus Anammoxibacter sp.]